MSEEKKLTIEERLDAIEEIVRKLEGGELTLEESLKEFESGIKLIRESETLLSEAKERLVTLSGNGAGDDL